MKVTRRTCFMLCSSLFVLYLAIHYWDALVNLLGLFLSAAGTLITGAVIAYVLNILMTFYERHLSVLDSFRLWQKLRRSVCMVLAFLTLVAAILVLIRLIVPQLISCFQVLLSSMPEVLRQLYDTMMENETISALMVENNLVLPTTEQEWRVMLEKAIDFLMTGAASSVVNTAVTFTAGLVGSVFSLLMSLIFTFNILAGKEMLSRQSKRLLHRLVGDARMDKVMHVINTLDDCFHNYIVGQCIEALILGSLCAIGMFILRLDYALMIGALIGVMALVPIVGAYIGAAVGAIMLFSVSPMKALIFLIFLLILQQIEGNLIYPHTVGSKMRLPGLWVLAAVLIGGGMMGIVGMILFVPLTAALYRLMGEWVRSEPKAEQAENAA